MFSFIILIWFSSFLCFFVQLTTCHSFFINKKYLIPFLQSQIVLLHYPSQYQRIIILLLIISLRMTQNLHQYLQKMIIPLILMKKIKQIQKITLTTYLRTILKQKYKTKKILNKRIIQQQQNQTLLHNFLKQKQMTIQMIKIKQLIRITIYLIIIHNIYLQNYFKSFSIQKATTWIYKRKELMIRTNLTLKTTNRM
ncbi:transmembrane protein, putative (macronuclear) [Tetrahymena thermophila SB210]|uniref:Transmembrane protein, putative n=1 Tax=Tetrahymena thermophila (strain SB210) TaxID=312017 RepID=W7X674_TETTS|nr:transmembrane protein, putative [Tetrahymena thermophila SB210]EWS71823.1 transmembrane protein, putative [Tetrahymena thermophila SB210]|eukprot:XP_012655645.1 transmembrane protein, putative [Tetrahymena thermophila SB210]